MYYSIPNKRIKEAKKSLDIFYSKIPETKGCLNYIGKTEQEGGCGGWCCLTQNPQVLYSEFLNTWEYVVKNFSDADFESLIERSVRKYLYPNKDKGCVFFNKDSKMCSQHESRCFNCRIYGIIPEEEFKPRYERLKVIYPETRDQCNLISTIDNKKVTKEDTDKWWIELNSIEIKMGIKPELINDGTNGTYRTYHDHLLLHLLSRETMAMMTEIRTKGTDLDKERTINNIMIILKNFKDQQRGSK